MGKAKEENNLSQIERLDSSANRCGPRRGYMATSGKTLFLISGASGAMMFPRTGFRGSFREFLD
jgi:hypothetical protein